MNVRVSGPYAPAEVFYDCTPDEARRQFHDQHPGWQGTIWKVEPVDVDEVAS